MTTPDRPAYPTGTESGMGNNSYASSSAAKEERSSAFSFGIIDVLRLIRLAIVPAIVFAAGLCLAAYLYLENTEPTYSVIAEVVVERKQLPTESDGTSESTRFNATQAEILKSPRIIGAALAKQPLPAAQRAIVNEANTTDVLWVLDKVTVSPVTGTQVISAVYDTTHPQHGVALLNSAVAEYLALARGSDVEQHEETLTLLLNSEQELRDRLGELQQQYREVSTTDESLGNGDDAMSLQKQMAESYNTQLIRTQREISSLETRRTAINRALANNELMSLPEAFVRGGTGAAIIESQVALAALLADFRENHPDVVSTRAQLGDLDQRLRVEAQEQSRNLREEIAAAEREAAELRRGYRRALASAKNIDSQRLTRETIRAEIESTSHMLEQASNRINDRSLTIGSIAGGRSGTVASVIRAPEVPLEAVWPRPKVVYMLAILLAGVLGLLVGLLRLNRVRREPTVYTPQMRSASELMRKAAQQRVA